MKRISLIFVGSLIAMMVPSSVEAAKTAALFSNHMVLQREQPVPVWGWAKPGEQVTVEFAGQKKTAQANSKGYWLIRLDPMQATLEGRELVVRSTMRPTNRRSPMSLWETYGSVPVSPTCISQ